MMHGCGSLPFASDGNPHTQLPWRLAHFSPVAGGFDIAQDPPPQPLRLPGAQGQLCQEYTVTQPTSIVPGYSYRLGAVIWQLLSQWSEPPQFSVTRLPSCKAPPVRSKLWEKKTWSNSARLRTTFLCGPRTICARWRRRMCWAKWTKEQTFCRGISSEEWTLHRLTVQKIWEIFGNARVDLFAS